MIREELPEFKWEAEPLEGGDGHFEVRIDCPFVDGLRPTLTSLLLGIVQRGRGATDLHKRYRQVYRLPEETVAELQQFIENARIAHLSPRQAS